MIILENIYKQILNENLIAYHGSGNEFNNFSNQYIGTGIGNAGFGYGMYLTSNKKEAKEWAKTLEKNSIVFIDGIKQSENIEKFVTSAIKLHGNNPELLLHILKIHSDNLFKQNKINQKEFNFIKNSNILKLIRSRFIYEVNVNAKDLIQWNNPISIEQVQKINKQAQIENKDINIITNNNIIIINGKHIKNGEDFYNSLNMSQKEKSDFFDRSGIDGILYYERNQNYVIFNPQKLTIKKKLNF